MMTQQFHIAFSILFKHQFFADGNLKSLIVTPTTETELILRNYGAIVKTFQQGIHVLYDSNVYGKERSRTAFLENGGSLKFIVMNKDTSFFNYTSEFNTDISRHYFFFGNKSYSANGKESLQAGTFVGEEDLRPVNIKDPDFFVKPFGIIAIKLHKDLEKNFAISFASAAKYWCYVVTTDHLQELANPAIVYKETKEAFKGPIVIQLTENTIGSAFFSKEVITQMERPVNTYQLVDDYNSDTRSYKVVIPTLPGPDRRHISSFKTIEEYKDKEVSYIFI